MKRQKLVRALLSLTAATVGIAAHAQSSGTPPLPSCASGMHLQHVSGMTGIVDPDAYDGSTAGEYRCVADVSATTLSCGAHGSLGFGEAGAFCGCETGYAGDSCNVCATGYAQDAAGGCAPAPVNRELVILGAERVVPFGGSTVLSAEYLSAPGRVATGAWALRGAPADVGCLAPADQPGVCLSRVEGSEVRYSPPASGDRLVTNEVSFFPAGGAPRTQVDVKADMPGQIPVNGWANFATLPVVDAVRDFMKARCIGAGSLGIARNGQVVAALGLGMKDGRNAEAIYNPACSSDATDPFKPDAEEMNYYTPFMFGSISKSMSFATARWAIKNALKSQDIDLRLINQSANRVVSAHRTLFGNLRITVWGVDAAGTFTEQGAHQPEQVKDFQLVRMGDTRFVLITRSNENKLHVYAYSIGANGVPAVTDTLLGVTEVKEVLVTAIKDQRIVVGLRRANDTLQMRTFKLEANNTFTALDTENGGSLRDLSLVALPGTARVVGAARLAYPDVTKFIVWDVADNGTLTRVHETMLDNMYYEDARLQMTALSSSRIVVGAQQGRTGPLGLNVFSIGAGGALALVGGTGIDNVSDFRLQSLAADRFAVVTKDASDNGKVQQFTLSGQGLPYQLGAGSSTGKARSLDLAGTSAAGFGLGFVTALRETSDTLRLASWDVGASALTKLKQGTTNLKVQDYGWTDADLESLSLVGYDFPNALVPRRLHEIVAGYVEPPMHFDATETRTDPDTICTATAAPGYPKADARWKNIRLGDFLAHRAGLNSSTIAAETLIDNNLGQIRGLTTKGQWAAQEDRLREQWGVQNVKDARVAAGLSAVVDYASPDGFLLPPITLEETLVGSASMCLPNPQGEFHYSNTDPQWVRMAMEHVSGQTYSAEVGKPETTDGTLLNDFLQTNLGFGSTGLNNVFGRPAALDAQGKDPFAGPRARHWDSSISGYYNTYWDVKRPICRWVNGTCSIANPKTGPSLNWNGEMEKVPLLMRSTGMSAATGSLGVQMLPYLKFLSKYKVGGYDSGATPDAFDSSIGEARSGSWTDGNLHDGGDDGTYAYAVEFGGGSCKISAGVDLIVSFNQWQDAQCNTDKKSCVGDPKRYQELYSILKTAVCASDWTKATPVPWLND